MANLDVLKNTTPISVSDLKTFSLSKIDFHSQNDQQLILKKDNQIDFLDRFCKVEEKVKEYQSYIKRSKS